MDDTAQATDPSVTQQHQGLRRRIPRQFTGPASDIAPVTVNSKYAPPLEDAELLEVAHVFSRLECQILQVAIQVLQNQTRDRDTREPDEQQRLIRIEKAHRDLLDVHAGLHQFSGTYLKDRRLLREWDFAAIVHRELFRLGSGGDQTNHQIATSSATHLERLASDLPATLKSAASKGSLDVLTRNAIGDKYKFLDAIVDLLHDQTSGTRDLSTWNDISDDLRSLYSNADTKIASQISGSTRLSIMLWITFVSTVVCSGPMLVYAWNFSDHQPGSWAEEDFFFLLQGCVMQVFGLVVTAIPLMKSKSVPVTAWALPSVFAVCFTLASPLLYCFVPKWWSSFCTLIAGSIQSFMVLQLALYGV